jgi:hypothetical protein
MVYNRRGVNESNGFSNCGLSAGHPHHRSVEASHEEPGRFPPGGQKPEDDLSDRHFLCNNSRSLIHHRNGGTGIQQRLSWGLVDALRHFGHAYSYFVFAGRIRATGCYTLPQLLGSFYGDRARTAASILIAVSWIGVIAVQIIASGKVLSAVFGGNGTLFMVICTVVFVLYTAHGGQSSVVRTDLHGIHQRPPLTCSCRVL